MTKKQMIFSILLITIAVVFTSCGAGTTNRINTAEIEDYENYIMSSYFMLRGGEELPKSRAAWDYTTPVAFPTGSEPATATKNNYPESGQQTTVKLEKTTENDVYKVTNTTIYNGFTCITNTIESYYVKDQGDGTVTPDGIFNQAEDPICEADGTINPLARIEFKTSFDDGTERNETIHAVFGGGKYAEFNIYDSLRFPNSSDPDTWGGGTLQNGLWAPGEGDSDWSSMVTYDQTVKYKLYFWTYSKRIIGVRYYTEQGTGENAVKTSVTYERTIARYNDDPIGDYNNWRKLLYQNRNLSQNSTFEDTVYTETVIRTKIDADGWKRVRSASMIYDNAGTEKLEFTAEFEKDAEGNIIKEGKPQISYR